MPLNRNALIRYRTIDNCLCNRQRRWSLDDLIKACSDALYEYEGIDKGVGARTVQMDIQMMRSDSWATMLPLLCWKKSTIPTKTLTTPLPISRSPIKT